MLADAYTFYSEHSAPFDAPLCGGFGGIRHPQRHGLICHVPCGPRKAEDYSHGAAVICGRFPSIVENPCCCSSEGSCRAFRDLYLGISLCSITQLQSLTGYGYSPAYILSMYSPFVSTHEISTVMLSCSSSQDFVPNESYPIC